MLPIQFFLILAGPFFDWAKRWPSQMGLFPYTKINQLNTAFLAISPRFRSAPIGTGRDRQRPTGPTGAGADRNRGEIARNAVVIILFWPKFGEMRMRIIFWDMPSA